MLHRSENIGPALLPFTNVCFELSSTNVSRETLVALGVNKLVHATMGQNSGLSE